MVVGAKRCAGDTAAEVETLCRRSSVSSHVRRLRRGQGGARLQSARPALRCYRAGYLCSHLAPIPEAQFRCSTDIQVRLKDSRYVLALL